MKTGTLTQLTFSWEELPAKPSPSLENAPHSTTTEATSHSPSATSPTNSTPDGSCGKTSPESYPQKTTPSAASWLNYADTHVPSLQLDGGGGHLPCGVVSGPKRTVAWRILDAQWFGVPQRRRRLFLIATRGSRNFQCADAILPIGESLHGDIKESRETWRASATHPSRGIIVCDRASFNQGSNAQYPPRFLDDDLSPTLVSRGPHAVVYENHPADSRITQITDDTSPTITSRFGTGGGNVPYIQRHYIVRRMTPTECERLQGFPDNYTAIPWNNRPAEQCPDSHRYKSLGNSMAVPVMRWIGNRINIVEQQYHDT